MMSLEDERAVFIAVSGEKEDFPTSRMLVKERL